MNINILKLHKELINAGFPVCSVREIDPQTSTEPVADYSRPLSAVEQDGAAAVIAAHDPTPDSPPPTETEQIAALRAALDQVTAKLVAGSLMTAEEAQAINPIVDIKTVT